MLPAISPPVRCIRALTGLVALLSATTGGFGSLRAAEQWLHARTPHFEMFSTESEKESRRILIALEQFRANFLASFPFPGAADPRTTIFLFRDERQFRPYKPLYEGKPKDVAGYCLPGTDEVMITLTSDLQNRDTDPTEVIFHEYIHLLLHVRDAKIPVWLNEGMAELYSTFRVDGNTVEFGLPKDQHVALLTRSSFLPLAKLFAVTHQSPDYNEEGRVGIFYAEAWALTHYLVCGEDRTNSAKLAKFIERVGASADPENAFREAFGSDYKPVELALRAYFDGGRYFKRSTPALLPDLEVKFQPAKETDKELALLNLRWRMHRSGDTAFRAYELLKQAPGAPRPYELLAAVALADGDSAKAQSDWLKAAERQSDNAVVYAQLAREALASFQGAALLTTRLPPERLAELRTWTDRALTLSPESAMAIEASALTEAMAEEFSPPAVNRVQRLSHKMREPSRTHLALAIIRWRLGDHATAAAIVDAVLAQRRASTETRAAAQLLRAKFPGADEATAGPAVDMSREALASRAAVALQAGTKVTATATLLDRILDERGTTAPRVKLAAAVAVAGKPATAPETDPWVKIRETRPRAAAGDASAMFEVAIAHATGIGAEFAPHLAAEWIERAAQAGHASASVAPRSNSGEADLDDAVCRFLRQQRPAAPGELLPPLDSELKARTAEAVSGQISRPLTPVHQPAPRFPAEQSRAGAGGEVLVRFRVDDIGRPQNLSIVGSAAPAFVEAAEECIRQWRFVPAIRDRKPVSTLVEVPVRFQIPPGPPP